jgi:hypothetical protein
MKKAVLILMVLLTMTGCGTATNMDEQAKDGNYHYENRDYSFTVTLPPVFEYYQTQRITEDAYVDVEFFLPTKDPEYVDETFPSYFKPLIVRVWLDESYSTLSEEDKDDFTSFGNKGNYVYSYKFTSRVPSDWTDRWNEDVKLFISDNLDIK